MQATYLRCEYEHTPLGIDVTTPRLSWKLQSEQRDARQTAYQIQAASSNKALVGEQRLLWDSGKVTSQQAVHIAYAGPDLQSRQRVWWRVRVWDGQNQASAYSESSWWEMGLLEQTDWQAEWITSAQRKSKPASPQLSEALKIEDQVAKWAAIQDEAVAAAQPSPYLRGTFSTAKTISQARVYASARGLYELFINGQRVGQDYFRPGWTDYNKRIQYQTYDVTELLNEGENAVGVVLGDGWYSGHMGFDGQHNNYGDCPQALVQLEITYVDGTRSTFISDDRWKASQGPILYSDLFMGENYDARLEMPGWASTSFDDSGWETVVSAGSDYTKLVAQCGPTVQKTEELQPQQISEPTPQTYVFDLGQNITGWARLCVKGAAGTTIRLRFAEFLNPDGTVYVTNLRAAKATEFYTLKGNGEEIYEPSFTSHGFRYVEVKGYPTMPGTDAITGIVVQSNTPPTGTFECSHPMVNQLVSNITWGQRGNFLEVPTDCPQRDERLGWTGDAEIFVRTASYNADVAHFFSKWLNDMDDAQFANGGIPNVIPNILWDTDGSPAWSDACIIVPWTIYLMYGDRRILEQHYSTMTRWIDYLDRDNPDHHWKAHRNGGGDGQWDFGDWLSIDADTPKDVLADAFYAYSTSLLAIIAEITGKLEDANKYRTLAEQIKQAFNTAYVQPDGRISGDTQTTYALALRFALLPEGLRPLATQHLVDDITRRGMHLSTGFLGVDHLLPVLTDNGQVDIAYQLLLQDSFPSWGYSIKHGATTIWERWDGWTADKGFQDVGMNSFNHYSLGSVGEWLYSYVAGIDTASDPAGAGFSKIILRPHPYAALSYVKATFDSVHGKIASAWQQENETFTWDVTVPPNTQATLYIPAGTNDTVLADGKALQTSSTAQQSGEFYAVQDVGSGTYQFVVKKEG